MAIIYLLVRECAMPRLIDLFSGAGGMTLGFIEEFGQLFTPVWANDVDSCAVNTYNTNEKRPNICFM